MMSTACASKPELVCLADALHPVNENDVTTDADAYAYMLLFMRISTWQRGIR